MPTYEIRRGSVKAYEQCASRVENRENTPPSRKYTDTLVKDVLDLGVEAVWNAAVGYKGQPLFRSRVVPNCRDEGDIDLFRYFIKSLHAIGRPVLSWYPLAINGALTEKNPEWKTIFFNSENEKNHADIYCCYNSPYGELLPQIAVEIVKDVGFDGIWFDGTMWCSPSSKDGREVLAGCKCQFCRDRFKKDTGMTYPTKPDFESREFRLWLRWRYQVMTDLWQRIIKAVKAEKPQAIIAFNNCRRRSPDTALDWRTAIPLRKLNYDCIMAGELDCFATQADFQMKQFKAYGCNSVESWWPLSDYWAFGPDTDPLLATQASLGCVSAGGVASCGLAANLSVYGKQLKSMQDSTKPNMPFLGGETVEYAAVLCSQQTQDYFGREDTYSIWNEWYGANEICCQSHIQSSIIFDDHIDALELAKYPLLILGNYACISSKQAQEIIKYVENGGSVFGCCRVGEFDELGYPHDRPVLDDLFGIVSRRSEPGFPVFRLKDKDLESKLGKWVTMSLGTVEDTLDVVVAEPEHGVCLLGDLVNRASPFQIRSANFEDDWYVTGTGEPIDNPYVPGLWQNNIGKGKALYCAANVFRSYLNSPTPNILSLLKMLMLRMSQPAITLEGPICVTMNVRKQNSGLWAIHLHNAPGSAHRYPSPKVINALIHPMEVQRAHDLKIKINKVLIKSAVSGITGNKFEINPERNSVTIPFIDLHEVVLVDFQ
jgi:hypothetical protein